MAFYLAASAVALIYINHLDDSSLRWLLNIAAIIFLSGSQDKPIADSGAVFICRSWCFKVK
jgi:hypothetical protein